MQTHGPPAPADPCSLNKTISADCISGRFQSCHKAWQLTLPGGHFLLRCPLTPARLSGKVGEGWQQPGSRPAAVCRGSGQWAEPAPGGQPVQLCGAAQPEVGLHCGPSRGRGGARTGSWEGSWYRGAGRFVMFNCVQACAVCLTLSVHRGGNGFFPASCSCRTPRRLEVCLWG